MFRSGARAVPALDGRSPGALRSRVGVTVVLDYLLSHLGFFAVLPVLPVLLSRLQPQAGAWFLGAALFGLNFCMRGASLFCASLLHRTPVRRAMAVGLALASLGFGLLPIAPGAFGILVCLLLAGTGISTNGLVCRVYVAMSLQAPAARNAVFSAIQVVVNVAAALGPVVANVMLAGHRDGQLLLLSVALYAAAAVGVLLTVPAGLRPRDGDVRPPLRFGLLRALVEDPAVRRVCLLTAVGGFLYAQFFSAVALQVNEVTDSVVVRAAFFTTNAVAVVVLQIPVSAWVGRRLTAGWAAVRFLGGGLVVFGVAFLTMAFLGATVAGLFLAVVIFSLAETLFTPTVNTAFGELPGGRPVVELFNLRQVAATAGESTGAFMGGAVFLTAARHGAGPGYWLFLAALAALAARPRRWRPRSRES